MAHPFIPICVYVVTHTLYGKQNTSFTCWFDIKLSYARHPMHTSKFNICDVMRWNHFFIYIHRVFRLTGANKIYMHSRIDMRNSFDTVVLLCKFTRSKCRCCRHTAGIRKHWIFFLFFFSTYTYTTTPAGLSFALLMVRRSMSFYPWNIRLLLWYVKRNIYYAYSNHRRREKHKPASKNDVVIERFLRICTMHICYLPLLHLGIILIQFFLNINLKIYILSDQIPMGRKFLLKINNLLFKHRY